MAECISCGKEIPEGNLYCNECETRMKADESYLDSLLSSVVANSAEPVQERPVKKTTAEPVASAFVAKEDPEELANDSFIIEEIEASYEEPESFDVIPDVDMTESYVDIPDVDMTESYVDIPDVDMTEPYSDMANADMTEPYGDMANADMTESYGDMADVDMSEPYEEVSDEPYDIFRDTGDSFLDDLFEYDATDDSTSEEPEASSEDELLADLLRSVDDSATEYEIDLDELHADAAAYEADFPTEASVGTEEELLAVPPMEEEAAESVFDSYDDALDAEAALMGAALAEEVFAVEEPVEAAVPEDDFFGMLSAQEPEAVPMEEDPFAMLGLAGAEEDVNTAGTGDDIMDIWGLMGSDTAEPVSDGGTADEFGDFPELFGEGDEYMSIPEIAAEEKEEASAKDAPKKKKKKKGLFKRVFGNVREDLTEEEIEERKRKALEKFEEDELKAADEAAREKLHKEQIAKLKEEAAAQKQAEKEALARKKAEEKRLKAEQKKLLKDKKEQEKRALLAEIEENEGKINKFGASIIIIMFAAVLCLITLGTSYYNYKISIDKAQFDFDLQRYDDAYNDVYGLEIKEEDMELYDKIMTVQYVNVQLLSYMRYHSLDMDAEALDSLIKGLRRYEKFIQHGTELGVKDDLNYLKTQIVEQLGDVFGIDEATAYEMLALETQEEYSIQIYDIVSKKN